jgi:hypothetical protein
MAHFPFRNSKCPLCVRNTIFSTSSWCMRTWWYRLRRSSLVKNRALWSSYNNSSTTNIGNLSFDSLHVQFTIVDAEAPGSITLLDQQDRGWKCGSAFPDDALAQHVVTLSFDLVLQLLQVAVWSNRYWRCAKVEDRCSGRVGEVVGVLSARWRCRWRTPEATAVAPVVSLGPCNWVQLRPPQSTSLSLLSPEGHRQVLEVHLDRA